MTLEINHKPSFSTAPVFLPPANLEISASQMPFAPKRFDDKYSLTEASTSRLWHNVSLSPIAKGGKKDKDSGKNSGVMSASGSAREKPTTIDKIKTELGHWQMEEITVHVNSRDGVGIDVKVTRDNGK